MEADTLAPPRPYLRGRLHQGGAAGLLGGPGRLGEQAGSTRARVAAWVYGLASVLLYLTSSSYHVFARSPKARRIMQRADHSMIFVLIACMFTPIAVLSVPDPWRWPALVTMWVGALGGIVLKVVAMGICFPVSAARLHRPRLGPWWPSCPPCGTVPCCWP